MTEPIILASTSEIRSKLLRNAGLDHTITPARIDEDSIKRALEAEEATPRDIADTLAEMKARKVAEKGIGGLVLGCDQVLSFKGAILSKPKTRQEAHDQLVALRGQPHQLLSAAVIYEDLKPVWRHVGVARLAMRDFSDAYLDDYLERNWDSIRWSVGGYKIEEEGIRLFRMVQGDTFTIQGIPLLELLSYLTLRGTLPT
ncbi:septum formation protein [Octadecabacter temperatus]|uniref:Nucleoside triphosphate pyrophosphatase n=1 Tax=Octadecabacter temperatus TaxID=1458307 RepID=A0A0K0Y9X1_9RHOB|nr:Maf family protein [Octadecabacter temperatus]AKS47723.1 Septum formation protein Maf [Octadecabacter temperatus]SIO39390.1 septum formation protein [Octadecabacter temperatus]